MQVETIANQITRGISILIYANPGVGKTTLASTLPVGETLFLSVEAGLGPLMGTGHKVKRIESIKDFDETYEYLRTQPHPYKFIVFDNISEWETKVVLELAKHRGKEYVELKEYGDAAFKIRDNLYNLRDLVYKGISVVFNAWEYPMKIQELDGRTVTKTFPKLMGKVSPEICGLVDIVGHLEVYEKNEKRWIRFGQSDQYVTKTQFKGLDAGEPANLKVILHKIHSAYEGGSDANKLEPAKETGDR